MRNTRALVMIVIAVAIGIAAVVIAAKWVEQKGTIATSEVVVAARDLELGTRLRPDMLKVVKWPETLAVKGTFKDIKPLVEESRERVLNAPVQSGEPVTETKLAPPGEKGGLSAVLKDGRRAITVKVNEIIGVAGFALPGNYVDVMVHTQDAQNKSISKIILEQILVLAVAQDVSQSETKPRVVTAVTLEVTPQQAESLDLARGVGSLSLVLRSQSDRAPVLTAGARKDDLLRATAPIPEAPKAAAKPAVTVKPVAIPAPPRVVTLTPVPAPEAPKVEVLRGTKKTFE